MKTKKIICTSTPKHYGFAFILKEYELYIKRKQRLNKIRSILE